ncbi:kinase-like domain-containing protein [Nemania abortiva]|nr:kinase-like domain-containing protein [Nemania abortiva]
MDTIIAELLRSWRLEARKEDGDWYHDLGSSTECWRPVKFLGSGTFGDVSQEQCVSASSQNEVRAVKRISKRQAHFSLSSRRELEALVTFSDTRQPEYQKHSVRFLGWFEDSVDLYIAMEFIQYGNLQQYINQGIFPEPEATAVTAQVAQALQYMHRRHFVHRDLKPMNILVSQIGPQWAVKVADFGIAKQTDGTAAGTHGIGTPGYMAPELFGSAAYTSAVDVWALGAVAFCMRTGFPPFATQMELHDYHRDQTKFPVRALGSSTGFCMNFVLGTMTDRPERRLTIDQVLAHDWLVIYMEATNSMGVRAGEAAAPTWGIEARNAWSNTYSGGSTAAQSLPTLVPESSLQDMGPWRTQSMPADSLPAPQPRSLSPLVAPASRKSRTPTPELQEELPSLEQIFNIPYDSRDKIARTDTASSTRSRQTASSESTDMSTPITTSSALATPPVTNRAAKSKAPAQKARQRTSRSIDRITDSGQPTASSEPAAQIASSDSHLVCETCNKTFKAREHLMAHVKVRRHTPLIDSEPEQAAAAEPPSEVTTKAAPDPFLSCKTCREDFKDRWGLMTHIKIWRHKPQVERSQIQQPTSPSPSPSLSPSPSPSLSPSPSPSPSPPPRRTRRTATPPDADEEYVRCGTCDRTFDTRKDLDRHTAIRRHRPKVKVDPSRTCIACSRYFPNRDKLFDHLERSGHARSLATGTPEKYTRPGRHRRRTRRQSDVSSETTEDETDEDETDEDETDKDETTDEETDEEISPDVDPRLTCLKCRRTFPNRNKLFEHLRASGHGNWFTV